MIDWEKDNPACPHCGGVTEKTSVNTFFCRQCEDEQQYEQYNADLMGREDVE